MTRETAMHRSAIFSVLVTTMLLTGLASVGGEKLVDVGGAAVLAPGESAEFSGANRETIRVTLVGVVDESRCPIGVQCFWEGKVGAAFEFRLDGGEAERSELHSHPPTAVRRALAGRCFALGEVTPYPREGESIDPAEYRVEIILEPGDACAGSRSTSG